MRVGRSSDICSTHCACSDRPSGGSWERDPTAIPWRHSVCPRKPPGGWCRQRPSCESRAAGPSGPQSGGCTATGPPACGAVTLVFTHFNVPAVAAASAATDTSEKGFEDGPSPGPNRQSAGTGHARGGSAKPEAAPARLRKTAGSTLGLDRSKIRAATVRGVLSHIPQTQSASHRWNSGRSSRRSRRASCRNAAPRTNTFTWGKAAAKAHARAASNGSCECSRHSQGPFELAPVSPRSRLSAAPQKDTFGFDVRKRELKDGTWRASEKSMSMNGCWSWRHTMYRQAAATCRHSTKRAPATAVSSTSRGGTSGHALKR